MNDDWNSNDDKDDDGDDDCDDDDDEDDKPAGAYRFREKFCPS